MDLTEHPWIADDNLMISGEFQNGFFEIRTLRLEVRAGLLTHSEIWL